MAPSARPSKAVVKDEKKSDDIIEAPAYNAENVQHNMKVIYYSRTFLSIVGGVVAGVLGLSAIAGFLCYFVIMLLVSGAITAKTKLDVFSYFDSWQRITVDGITAGFMSFVLFWTYPSNLFHAHGCLWCIFFNVRTSLSVGNKRTAPLISTKIIVQTPGKSRLDSPCSRTSWNHCVALGSVLRCQGC